MRLGHLPGKPFLRLRPTQSQTAGPLHQLRCSQLYLQIISHNEACEGGRSRGLLGSSTTSGVWVSVFAGLGHGHRDTTRQQQLPTASLHVSLLAFSFDTTVPQAANFLLEFLQELSF